MATQKYRPYFTPAELSEVIRCLKIASHSPELIQYMERFALQISHGTIGAQLTLMPTVEEKLGMDTPPKNYSISTESLYTIWQSRPDGLTPQELAKVHQYRWGLGLMTPEESTVYENALLDSPSTDSNQST